MPENGDVLTVYDAYIGVDGNTAFGAWVCHWMIWEGDGAILRSENAAYVYMLVLRSVEEYSYTTWLFSTINRD